MAAKEERHTLSVLVDNEPGVLARIVSLFSGRGYNIESLTVSEVQHQRQRSRITIVTKATPKVLDQIRTLVERLIPVHTVVNLTETGDAIERELALVKIEASGEARNAAKKASEMYGARVASESARVVVFSVAGQKSEIDDFVAVMKEHGLLEVVRTGLAAIGRGPETL